MNTCKDCFYWDSKVEFDYLCKEDMPCKIRATSDPNDTRLVILGFCRRYAPQPDFANAREDDWCGDFKSKKDRRKS